jgi:hypothetical protein
MAKQMTNTMNTIQVNVLRAMLSIKFSRQYVVATDDSFSITYTIYEELPPAVIKKLRSLSSDLMKIGHKTELECSDKKMKLKVNWS